MSHFTKLDRAQIVSSAAFIKACKDLGLTNVKENCKIKDYYGKMIDVDVAINTGKYDLALQKNDSGKFDMIADWWGVRGERNQEMSKHGIKTDEDLQDFLLRHSTKHTIIDNYRKQGFRATVTEDADQNLNVSLMRA